VGLKKNVILETYLLPSIGTWQSNKTVNKARLDSSLLKRERWKGDDRQERKCFRMASGPDVACGLGESLNRHYWGKKYSGKRRSKKVTYHTIATPCQANPGHFCGIGGLRGVL